MNEMDYNNSFLIELKLTLERINELAKQKVDFDNYGNNDEDISSIFQDYHSLENDYKNIVDKHNVLLNNINNKLRNTCKHNFVTDSIDLDVDISKQIIYCSKCYLNET